MDYETLYQYGLTARVTQEASAFDGYYLVRVIRQHRDLYRVAGEQGEMTAAISGRLMRELQQSAGYPAVGDWVMTDRENDAEGNAIIQAVLPRKSAFTRKSAGSANAVQTVAANVDTIFLCMALNEDYNLRRLERYLTVGWDSGATPIIVLTKADLCADLPQRMDEIALIGMGAEIVVCSVVDDPDCAALRTRVRPGETAAFLGSSGVGKSTLINRLLGREALLTREIGAD
ncbi:MAG: GTPase RsgA, partial [Bacillota bacterium]